MNQIAFIGGGNMAQAIIAGLKRLEPMPSIMVAEPDEARRDALAAWDVAVTADNALAVDEAQIVVLAVKPQVADTVLPEIAAAWNSDKQVLVSILAGTRTRRLEAALPAGAHVVRVMPNTPMAIGRGMAGICKGAHANDQDIERVSEFMRTCAEVLVVEEERMDALTAISGSGPAYFFRFAEALHAAAMNLGFSADEARLLVAQTGTGAWHYLVDQDFRAAELRQAVTSPGGTTAAALAVLDEAGFDGLVAAALKAAETRGRELAGG